MEHTHPHTHNFVRPVNSLNSAPNIMMVFRSIAAVILAALLGLKYNVSAFEHVRTVRGALLEEEVTNEGAQALSPGRTLLAANEKATVRGLQVAALDGMDGDEEGDELDERKLNGYGMKKVSMKKVSMKKMSMKKMSMKKMSMKKMGY